MEAGAQQRSGPPGGTFGRPAAARGDDQGLLILAALISVLTTTGIVLALLGRRSTSSARSASRLPVRHQVDAAVQPTSFGVLPLIWHFVVVHRARRGDPARARRRDLPLRVRAAARAQDDQADARAAGRRPDDRLRLLRADLLHADDPAATCFSLDVSIFNALAAGIIMGFLVVPTIASIAEDAMSAVPAVAARGRLRARRLQAPGLAAGRLPGGAVGHRRRARARRLARGRRDDDRADRRRARSPSTALDPRERNQTMAAFIGATAKRRHPDRHRSSTRRSSPSACTLFVLTLVLNMISIRFVRKYRQVYE